MSGSDSSGGGRTQYVDQITVQGELGSKTYRRDDEPELGYGDIALVADFTGVVDFRGDAVIGPLSLGETVAEEFRDDVGSRLSDAEFKDFTE